MIKNFPFSHPPHIHSPESSVRRTWRFSAALLPAWAAVTAQRPAGTLRVFALVFTGVLVSESIGAFLSKRKFDFRDGSSVLWAFLLAFLIPEHAASGMVLLSAAAAVFLGKSFFGGRTGVWLHPALLGYAVFVLSFPGTAGTGNFSFWNPFTDLWTVLMTSALLGGGFFLTLKKNTAWEIPFLYLTLLFISCQFLGLETHLSLPLVLLNAFWILPEPASSPCSRRGRAYCAVAAALLTLALDLLTIPAAPVFAVLLLNLLTPWMDEWILPEGISFEARVQGVSR